MRCRVLTGLGMSFINTFLALVLCSMVKNLQESMAVSDKEFASMSENERFACDDAHEDPVSLYHHAKETNDENAMLTASLGLINVQKVYGLSIFELSRGKLLNISVKPLRTNDLYLIGKFAMKMSLHKEALPWLEAAEAIVTGKESPEVTRACDSDCKNSHPADTDEEELAFNKFSSLCKGIVANSESSGLLCYVSVSTRNYAFVKIEVLHQDPIILYYHNILTDEERKNLSNISKCKFSDSEEIDEEGEIFKDYSRISKSLFIDSKERISKSINAIVTDVTGLNTTVLDKQSPSELLQITHYDPGGGYHPHVDFLGQAQVDDTSYLADSGDRIATFMFYLKSPKLGGATVFPKLGIRSEPVQGSGLLWFNLMGEGQGDPRTLHAGCPVLVGQKTIANKWIREAGQKIE